MSRRLFCPAGACVAFAAVALLVAGGLAWVTVASLGVETAHREATARADRLNKEHLALWRLDGQLLPAIGLEGNRPFGHYAALNTAYPAVDLDRDVPAFWAVRLPSPLLSAELPDWMLLHFQIDPETGWESPQVLPPETVERLQAPPLFLDVANVTPERERRLAELRVRFPLMTVLAALSESEKESPADSPFVVPFPLVDETTATKPAMRPADDDATARPGADPTDEQPGTDRPPRTAPDQPAPVPPAAPALAAQVAAPGFVGPPPGPAKGEFQFRYQHTDEQKLRAELAEQVTRNRGVYEYQNTLKGNAAPPVAALPPPSPKAPPPGFDKAPEREHSGGGFGGGIGGTVDALKDTAEKKVAEDRVKLQRNGERKLAPELRQLEVGKQLADPDGATAKSRPADAADARSRATGRWDLGGMLFGEGKPAGDMVQESLHRALRAGPPAPAGLPAPGAAPGGSPVAGPFAKKAASPPVEPAAPLMAAAEPAAPATAAAMAPKAADAPLAKADADRLGAAAIPARRANANAAEDADGFRPPVFEIPPVDRKPAPTVRPAAVHLGPMRPRWLAAADGTAALVLVRAARLEHKTVYQGVLLDWPRLQAVLAGRVADLFPAVALAPVRDAAAAPERTMTALPAQLDPGPPPALPPAGWTPLRLGLALAWAAALLALAAVGVVGASLVDLSERRIRFVSAVTHELRTPLTSLRLYLDLLTSGMIADEEQQREYLKTLSGESDRLHALVQNVLDFARLEKSAAQAHRQPTPVSGLLDEVRGTWADRLAADGMALHVVATVPADRLVSTDARVAAQVLGNLVDNARKYARGSADGRVWVRATPGDRGRVAFEVEERCPGAAARDRKLLFRPFRRGELADTQAGGAGLGLALAKQWAELLGGKLVYRPADGGVGACFRLELPGA